MKYGLELAIAVVAGVAVTVAAMDATAQPRRSAPDTAGTTVAQAAQPLTPLTAEQVKTVVQGHLIMQRSDLTVGKISEKAPDAYEVELVKPDGSVARHLLIDKQTGRPSTYAPCPMGGPGGGGMGMGMGMGPRSQWVPRSGD